MTTFAADDVLEFLHALAGFPPLLIKDNNGLVRTRIDNVVTTTQSGDILNRQYTGASSSTGFANPAYYGSIGAANAVDAREQWKAASDMNIIQTVNRWTFT